MDLIFLSLALASVIPHWYQIASATWIAVGGSLQASRIQIIGIGPLMNRHGWTDFGFSCCFLFVADFPGGNLNFSKSNFDYPGIFCATSRMCFLLPGSWYPSFVRSIQLSQCMIVLLRYILRLTVLPDGSI